VNDHPSWTPGSKEGSGGIPVGDISVFIISSDLLGVHAMPVTG
jgi:hypothetical protein